MLCRHFSTIITNHKNNIIWIRLYILRVLCVRARWETERTCSPCVCVCVCVRNRPKWWDYNKSFWTWFKINWHLSFSYFFLFISFHFSFFLSFFPRNFKLLRVCCQQIGMQHSVMLLQRIVHHLVRRVCDVTTILIIMKKMKNGIAIRIWDKTQTGTYTLERIELAIASLFSFLFIMELF